MRCKYDLIVSVCPTFRCDNRCDFCYLGSKRECHELLSVDRLNRLLGDIERQYNIIGINVFGGEISTLGLEYLGELKKNVERFCQNTTFSSNLTDPIVYQVFDRISTSINTSRPDFRHVLNQMNLYKNTLFDASVVILDDFLNVDPRDFYGIIPQNCKTITFQKYSRSIYNRVTRPISDDEHQRIVMRFIDFYLENYTRYPFFVTNIQEILDCLDMKYDNSARSNLFILPNGRLASIDYSGELEFFREHESLEDFDRFCLRENAKKVVKCGICEQYTQCYCEHWNGNVDCCGNKGIILYYKSRKHDLCRILEAHKQVQLAM